MSAFGEDSPTRHRLGDALRTLRRNAGLSGQHLAEQLGISQSSLSRAETGERIPPAELVVRWGRAAGASEERIAELAELTEAVTTEAVVFRRHVSKQRGLVAMQAATGAMEQSSRLVRVYHPTLVPGLMQVPEYTRGVYQARWGSGQADLGKIVAARMDRQAALHDPTRRFEFVVGEPALRWWFGSREVMAAQLDRIVQVAGMSNVHVGILPLGTETPWWRTHHFTLYERDPEPMVHVELLTTGVNIRDSEDVAEFRARFEQLLKVALTGPDARALLARVAEDLRAARQS